MVPPDAAAAAHVPVASNVVALVVGASVVHVVVRTPAAATHLLSPFPATAGRTFPSTPSPPTSVAASGPPSRLRRP